MHHHAPAVRVCVYEGWRPLQESARRKLAEVNKGADKRIANNKRKLQQRERSATVSKYAKKARVTQSKSRSGIPAIEVPIKEEFADKEEVGEVKDADDVATLLDVTQREFLRYVRAHDVIITTYQDCTFLHSVDIAWR